jgi:hypothetical protein
MELTQSLDDLALPRRNQVGDSASEASRNVGRLLIAMSFRQSGVAGDVGEEGGRADAWSAIPRY